MNFGLCARDAGGDEIVSDASRKDRLDQAV
jgi:hypothetical protein